MGMSLNEAVIFRDWFLSRRVKGPLATLGVIDVRFRWGEYAAAAELAADGTENGCTVLPKTLFATYGIHDVTAIDISDYEGAGVIFDLNDNNLPPKLTNRFGAVLNAGTLEHIFHVPNALTNITRMLLSGGCVVHILPVQNCVDHGFYQFSPTLMFDYYEAAGFELLESAALMLDSLDERWSHAEVIPLFPGTFGMGLLGVLDKRIMFHLFMVRKGPRAVDRPVPVQKLYRRTLAGDLSYSTGSLRWFSSFELENGRRIASALGTSLPLGPFTHDQGHAWTCSLPPPIELGDSAANPVDSRVMICEDQRFLGPPHMPHDAIRRDGRGAFSHWGRVLYMSSSDGSNPNNNGRRYRVLSPGALN